MRPIGAMLALMVAGYFIGWILPMLLAMVVTLN